MAKAIFGGSFDPFHLGHLAILENALAQGGFSEILILPVGQPPLKGRRPLPASFRTELIKLTCKDSERLKISDLELRRPADKSYTYESLRQLRSLESDQDWSLICGSDVLYSLAGWYRPKEVCRLAKFYIAHRAGEDRKKDLEQAEWLRANLGARIAFFEMPGLDLSSSQIRTRIRANSDYSGLALEAQNFCRKWSLYKLDSAWQELSIDNYIELAELELKIAEILSPGRVFHSLSVLLYGLNLCKIHQIEPNELARGAILHDLAKEWPVDRQLEFAGQLNLDSNELCSPLRLHGFAAAAYARDQLGFKGQDLIEAIALHTSTGKDVSRLTDLLFLADTLEPGRKYADRDKLASLAARDLDQAVVETLESKFKYVDKLGYKDSAAELRDIWYKRRADLSGR